MVDAWAAVLRWPDTAPTWQTAPQAPPRAGQGSRAPWGPSDHPARRSVGYALEDGRTAVHRGTLEVCRGGAQRRFQDETAQSHQPHRPLEETTSSARIAN